MPVSIGRMTLPAPVTSHDDLPRRTTATGRSGATLTTSVCGNARSTETPATVGQRAQRPFDRVRVDGDEARSDEIARGAVCTSRATCGRRAADVDALDREHRRRVGDPVRDASGDQDGEADDERAAGGDEAHEVQASTGRTSRKRDDDACRSAMPTRTARTPSPDHAAGFGARGTAPT